MRPALLRQRPRLLSIRSRVFLVFLVMTGTAGIVESTTTLTTIAAATPLTTAGSVTTKKAKDHLQAGSSNVFGRNAAAEATEQQTQSAKDETDSTGNINGNGTNATNPTGGMTPIVSGVTRIHDSLRIAPLSSILMSSVPNRQYDPADPSSGPPTLVRPTWLYLQVVVFLAVRHWNERQSYGMVPALSSYESCDLQLSMDFFDSNFNPLVAAGKFLQAASSTRRPVAMIGEIRSAVSQVLATLGGVEGVPLVSSASTSTDLDNKDSYPYFGRTIPTNVGDAEAFVYYATQTIGISNIGLVYVRDSYGTAFGNAVVMAAQQNGGLSVTIASYEPVLDQQSVNDAISALQRGGVKHIFAVLNTGTFRYFMGAAVEAGIAGTNEHVWYLSEEAAVYAQEAEAYDDPLARQGLQYAALVELYIPPPPAFVQMLEDFRTNESLQEEFLAANDNAETIREQMDFSGTEPPYSVFYAMGYDSVMALGMAGCSTRTDIFDGPDIYAEFLHLRSFQGVSGKVSIDANTGTRALDGIRYAIRNLIPNEEQGRFDLQLSSVVELRGSGIATVNVVDPFQYGPENFIAPADIPPLEEDLLLIPPQALLVGYILCGTVLGLSLACAWFTFHYRDRAVVKQAQPVFLYVMCTGTFVMGSTIILLTFQEPIAQKYLDVGCTVQLWTVSLGFTAAYSALFCRMRRLNKLLSSGLTFRRVTAKAKDVLPGFMILMSFNAIVLIAWTVADPFVRVRVGIPRFDDSFGRPTKSVGKCSSEDKTKEAFFFSAFFLINFIALLLAVVECWKARNHPTRYQESQYIAVSMISLLEEAILGVPLVFVLSEDPEGLFLLSASMVALLCVTILLPTFIPKWRRRHDRANQSDVRRRVSFHVSNGEAPLPSNIDVSQLGYSVNHMNKASWCTPSMQLSLNLDTHSEVMGNSSSSAGQHRARRQGGILNQGGRTTEHRVSFSVAGETGTIDDTNRRGSNESRRKNSLNTNHSGAAQRGSNSVSLNTSSRGGRGGIKKNLMFEPLSLQRKSTDSG